jgi:hypothetical protein
VDLAGIAVGVTAVGVKVSVSSMVEVENGTISVATVMVATEIVLRGSVGGMDCGKQAVAPNSIAPIHTSERCLFMDSIQNKAGSM